MGPQSHIFWGPLAGLGPELARGGGGHSHRPCTSTRDRGQNVGQVAKGAVKGSRRISAGQNSQNWSKGRLQVGVASFPLK